MLDDSRKDYDLQITISVASYKILLPSTELQESICSYAGNPYTLLIAWFLWRGDLEGI